MTGPGRPQIMQTSQPTLSLSIDRRGAALITPATDMDDSGTVLKSISSWED
jgi:hypothetical protein